MSSLPSSTSPTSRQSLNPRAASFKVDPARLESLSPSSSTSRDQIGAGAKTSNSQSAPSSRSHSAVAPSAVAAVGAPSGLSVTPSDKGHESSSPSTSSLLAPSPAQAPSPSPPPLLMHRRLPTRSTSPSASMSSLSSRYSLLPLRTFQKLHLLVFVLTFLLLFVLPVTLLALYRQEVRWQPFLLGLASWLAGETLREVIFELFTFSGSGRSSSGEGAIALPSDEEEEQGLEAVTRTRVDSNARLALPSILHSVAQELLRLGAVAVAVALLPPAVGSIISDILLATATSDSTLSTSHRRPRIPYPPPRRPLPPLDPLLWSVLWLALGWASVEIAWGSRRLWKQLELYDDVLGGGLGDEEAVLRGVPREEEREEGEDASDAGSVIIHGHLPESENGRPDARRFSMDGEGGAVEREAEGLEHEEDYEVSEAGTEDSEYDEEWFQQRLKEVQREELEASLGVPLYEIPVGVVFVWRLDSILLSLVFTLFISLPFRLTPPSLFAFPLWPTFAFVALTHALLSYVWVSRVTKWGVPAISFASLCGLVLLVFAALGAWGVLE